MQIADAGVIQKNSASYQLTISKADPWLIYFNESPKKHLKYAQFIPKNQFYPYIQNSATANKNSHFPAEIIAFDSNNSTIHYYGFINQVNYSHNDNKVSYQLNLTSNSNLINTNKTKLKHVVLLISGDDICINCGGPW